MKNLRKYRSLSMVAIIAMIIALLLTFASLWNSLLTSDVKKEGWVVACILLLFIIGIFISFIAYKMADHAEIEKIRKEAYESGKSEILQEIERRKQEEKSEQKIETEEINKIAETILSGMQGIRTTNGLCNKVLGNLAKELGFVQGIVFVKEKNGEIFNPVGDYALTNRKPEPFKVGDTLPGQVAANKTMMNLYDIPENYFMVASGLGNAQPRSLMIVPALIGDDCIAVLELASFKILDEKTSAIVNKVSSELGIRLNKFVVA